MCELRWLVQYYEYDAYDGYDDVTVWKRKEYPPILQYHSGDGVWEDVPTVEEKLYE